MSLMTNKELAEHFMNELFEHIKHGDEDHQAWLRAKLSEFVEPLNIWLQAAEVRGEVRGFVDGVK